MNPQQKEEFRRLSAQLSGKERKELVRRAAELRASGQRDPKSPRARWCVDRWSLHLLEEQNPAANENIGTVISVAKARAFVRLGGEDHACELGRDVLERQQSVLAPGDRVRLEWHGHAWRIQSVLERRTVLTRLDPYFKERERAIVANVDVVVVVLSVVAPPLHPRIVDRYLAAIHKGGADALIVVNKIDLHEDGEARAEDLAQLDPYREMGVPVFAVSTQTGEGLMEVREALGGKVSVFVGHSGVGKSSLLSALVPDSGAVAGAVSEYSGKGRHTTTRAELVEAGEMTIVDTPGIREFSVEFRLPAEVAECFEEFGLAGRCRFGDCLHLEEPGCSVREAVRTGTISRVRYQSYRRLISDVVPASAYDEDEPPDERRPSFACQACGSEIPRGGGGTEHRNHCPRCLCSLHLDAVPGDRLACCGGVMEPIAVWVRKGGEWAIVHRCRDCGHLSSNRIAADDNDALLLSLAVRPLSKPPFPLERLGAGIAVS
ncbi:ribosome small subunit-dependent GTPase A [Fimbriimonas ginsengisoli]|uniref:Small ribosomal subunit biogenesis GTPase RsgA n=1 Tax=Fimbriimonas ginsengisoli Gsoil 348 TaxID=661478 RepID=A0A068NP40_FIMGI|nr:ribosome small subunit-dependent GTPase A [Fimbriimonas ginsengisoli]AIE85127.1 Ribosome small subunit-stimulated GTPase EngC [Fimbriimonas ginsengisoli Gsoil 348]